MRKRGTLQTLLMGVETSLEVSQKQTPKPNQSIKSKQANKPKTIPPQQQTIPNKHRLELTYGTAIPLPGHVPKTLHILLWRHIHPCLLLLYL